MEPASPRAQEKGTEKREIASTENIVAHHEKSWRELFKTICYLTVRLRDRFLVAPPEVPLTVSVKEPVGVPGVTTGGFVTPAPPQLVSVNKTKSTQRISEIGLDFICFEATKNTQMLTAIVNKRRI